MKTSLFQFRLSTALISMAIIAACIAAVPYVRAHLAIRSLSNDDLTFHANTFGRMITLEGNAATTLRALGSKSNHELLESLKDRTKFAAAHSLLKEINAEQFEKNDRYWSSEMDPLRNLNTYSDDEILELARFWNRILNDP